MSASRERLAMLLVLAVAILLRLPGLFHDLPFSYYGDELHFVKRSMALGTGDLNPHWFHKPAFLMYLLLASFGMLFLGGRFTGQWGSPEEFGAFFLADQGPFLLTARLLVFAFGIGTVWVGARIARRVGGAATGVVAGAFLALLPAMVEGSQVVKADIPSAFFVALAAWVYLRSADSDRLRPIVLAGLFAGASMGTKYYGVIALPGIVLAELLARAERGRSWPTVLRRIVLLGAVFVATFFVTSPYNFLDPMWRETVVRKVSHLPEAAPASGGVAWAEESTGETHFDPDSGVEFEPGLGSLPGALVHFGRELVDVRALGAGFLLLIAIGLVASLGNASGRRAVVVLATPAFIFTLFAVTIMAYHVNPRQLTAVFPFLAAFVWPGACALARLLRARGTAATVLAGVFVLSACAMPVERTLRVNRALTLEGSRTVAYHWILENIPPDQRVLLDDYGPIVAPALPAVARLQERLEGFPVGEAFTQYESVRLELLRRYPPVNGRDVDLLGHPWWLPRETPDEELRASLRHRDMGNPLLDRTPQPLAAYEAQGYDWIVTNSEAQQRYFESEALGEAFPSFRRFYEALHARKPYHVIDPEEWGGNGPVVTVYRLSRS